MQARELGSVTRTGKGPTVQTLGRKCLAEDCSTLLSRYNASEVCYFHEEPDVHRSRFVTPSS